MHVLGIYVDGIAMVRMGGENDGRHTSSPSRKWQSHCACLHWAPPLPPTNLTLPTCTTRPAQNCPWPYQLISSSPQHPWLCTLGISQWLVTSFSKSLRWQGLLCLHMPCCGCLMSYSFLVIVLEAKDKTTYQAVMMVSCSCHHHQCWDF